MKFYLIKIWRSKIKDVNWECDNKHTCNLKFLHKPIKDSAYQKWSKYKSLSNQIERAEKELIESKDERGSYNPFSLNGRRSSFGPTWSKDEIDQMKMELKNLPSDFEEPVRYSTR